VSKRYLFWSLGLAFERKADAPSYWKDTKMEGSNEAIESLGLSRELGGFRHREDGMERCSAS
jgi:hypothetical protein